MKQLPHTPFITALLKKTLGEAADTASLPVFEVVATSSVPLKKQGLYDGAIITPTTMAQMAQWVNNEALPLMQDHNMEGTPKGKFFYGEMRQDSGIPELRGLFYIDPTETELVAKANSGTLDETSVGFLPSSLKCSACSWDYMAALKAGNYEPMLNKTCANGHALGKGGVHAKVDGLEDFMELSLVSRGAAKNSKIIGNDNAKLGAHIEKLAAAGFDTNELYLTASASQGENNVDLTELIAKLGQTTVDLALANANVTRLEASATQVTTLQTEIDTTKARVTELEGELETAKAAVAPTEDAEALTLATDFIGKQYVAVLAAAGKTDAALPDNIKDMVAGITENHAKLSAILPIGGVGTPAGETNEAKDDATARLSAFKRNKK